MNMLVNKTMAPQSPLDSQTENIESHLSQNLDIFNLLLPCDVQKGLNILFVSKNLDIDIKIANFDSVIMNYLKFEGGDNHFGYHNQFYTKILSQQHFNDL